MRFTDNELRQFSQEYLKRLPEERIFSLCCEFLQDLKDTRDRCNSNSSNSSVPPSKDKPWERDLAEKKKSEKKTSTSKSNDDEDIDNDNLNDNNGENNDHPDMITEPNDSQPSPEGQESSPIQNPKTKPKPGKQQGAKGFGRSQKLTITETVYHKPSECHGCGCKKCENHEFEATGAFYVLDLEPPNPEQIGLRFSYVKHIIGMSPCDDEDCKFITEIKPKTATKSKDGLIHPGERGLIGPMFLALLMFFKYKMNMTIGKTREFLSLWLGILLSDGCISKALIEGGLAARSMEPQILELLRTAGLLHLDETTWKLHKVTRWCWIATGEYIAYYAVGPRTVEMAESILGNYTGWIMADGYKVYRRYEKRLRCWPHIDRKAQGLIDSCDKDANTFGEFVLEAFRFLRNGVYKMRQMEGDALEKERAHCEDVKTVLLIESLKGQETTQNEKTRQLKVEILNDTKAIFAAIQHPNLPISNNRAEQGLRWVVIMRNISHGSKTVQGAEGMAAFASLMTTLYLRKENEWLVPKKQQNNQEEQIANEHQNKTTNVQKSVVLKAIEGLKAVEANPGIERPLKTPVEEDFEPVTRSYAEKDKSQYHVDSCKEKTAKMWIWSFIALVVSKFRSGSSPPPFPEPS